MALLIARIDALRDSSAPKGGPFLVAMALALLVQSLAQAQGFWSFLPANETLRRCAKDSAAHVSAERGLRELDVAVERLGPADSPGPSVETLYNLLKTECFWMASESLRLPKPDSVQSLQEWWRSGGESWLAAYLELPMLGLVEALQPHVVLPPDTRKTLSADTAPQHPLRRFLCDEADLSCGSETQGWVLRAEAAFETHHDLGKFDNAPRQFSTDPLVRSQDASTACDTRDASAQSRGDYSRWRACIEGQRPTRTALPLGRFRAPSDGWLIVEGRRGHYDFCDSVSAFNLKTGGTFVFESCSGLALLRDGSVDRDATNRARKERAFSGVVDIGDLREAAWMMMFRGETEQIQLRSETYPLPADMVPELVHEERSEDFTSMGAWWNSGQTTLAWRLVLSDKSAFAGELTWPTFYDAAEDHAGMLLSVVEQGLVEGCAGRPPGDGELVPKATPQLLKGVAVDGIEALMVEFRKAAPRWRLLRNCRPASHR